MGQNGHFGPKWPKMAILAHLASLIPGFDDVLGPIWPEWPKWPFWAILAQNHHFGPYCRYRAIYRGFKGGFGPFWAILAQNDQKSPFLAYFGSFWGVQMGPDGPKPLILAYINRPIWPYGPKWPFLAIFGHF